MRTRQGKLFFWGFGFALPRLISRPQEGSGEECGRVLDWGLSEKKFVPVKLARTLDLLNHQSQKYRRNICYQRNNKCFW